jgi:hypothetical protein
MPRSWIVRSIVPLALAATAQAQHITHLEALSMDGSQEVPPVTTTATGRGDWVLNTFTHRIHYNVSFQNLSSAETDAHIHQPAPPGQNAPPVHFYALGSPKTGFFDVTPAQEAEILAGQAYTNIHSANFTTGEIRGQMVVAPAVGTSICAGDGTGTACPCGNSGAANRGCENSSTTGGAILGGWGHNSPDNIVLISEGEKPSALSIFFQGDTMVAAAPFGDGLSCIGGTTVTLAAKNATGGAVAYPEGAEESITARSATLGQPIPPGSTRFYVVYYRDPDPSFCPAPSGSTFNASNGLQLQW